MPIIVYEPFLEATQDEKQYRVVKDRERWLNVVMGEKLELDEASTDLLAARIPLPDDLARAPTLLVIPMQPQDCLHDISGFEPRPNFEEGDPVVRAVCTKGAGFSDL